MYINFEEITLYCKLSIEQLKGIDNYKVSKFSQCCHISKGKVFGILLIILKHIKILTKHKVYIIVIKYYECYAFNTPIV